MVVHVLPVFALGGHSLSGTQLILRIKHLFFIKIPLRNLFEMPTIASQSKEIDRLQQLAMLQNKDLEQLLSEIELLQAEDK